MNLFRPWRPGQRLGSLYTLALVLLGLVAAVALFQADFVARQWAPAGDPGSGIAHSVPGLARLVDDGRGLEALHLLQDDAAPRLRIEQGLLRQRRLLQARLDAHGRLAGAAERGHLDLVAQALDAYWTVQDRLLLASHRAHHDPALAVQARELLGGESQQAYRAVIDALQAWWRFQDGLAEQAASQSRSGLLLRLRTGLAALLGLLGLLLGRALNGVARAPRPAPRGADVADSSEQSHSGACADFAEDRPGRRGDRRAADGTHHLAGRAVLTAMNATVQAARGGVAAAAEASPSPVPQASAMVSVAAVAALAALAAAAPTSPSVAGRDPATTRSATAPPEPWPEADSGNVQADAVTDAASLTPDSQPPR